MRAYIPLLSRLINEFSDTLPKLTEKAAGCMARRMTSPLIIIPSRMDATRLPNKPLADICGKPMIARMVERALKADAGRVVIATDHEDIKAVAEAEGGEAVLTDPALPSGTDRVFAALSQIDAGGVHDIIVNLQGDMPCFDPAIINMSIEVLASQPDSDISTLVAPMHLEEEKQNDAVVKAVVAWSDKPGSEKIGKALYFSRCCAPTGGPWWHHLGIYAFRRNALETFVALSPSPLEKSERLEQLRALEAGMQIGIGKVDAAPLGVDTPETLEMARRSFSEIG